MKTLAFAWIVCKHVKSNAIVMCQGTATVGVGAGQPNRIDAVGLAGFFFFFFLYFLILLFIIIYYSYYSSYYLILLSLAAHAKEKSKGAILASDAFFPFADGIEKVFSLFFSSFSSSFSFLLSFLLFHPH